MLPEEELLPLNTTRRAFPHVTGLCAKLSYSSSDLHLTDRHENNTVSLHSALGKRANKGIFKILFPQNSKSQFNISRPTWSRGWKYCSLRLASAFPIHPHKKWLKGYLN